MHSNYAVCLLYSCSFFNRNILVSMPNNLKHEWQSNFLSDFVMPLRDFYETAHGERSSLSVFCSQGDWKFIYIRS